jgi:hypothetical protein
MSNTLPIQKRPPGRSAAQLRRQIERWNSRVAVGTKICVRLDSGEARITTTRSEAYILSGHSAVIMLDGISGCYSLDRVVAVP